jgi:trypsin
MKVALCLLIITSVFCCSRSIHQGRNILQWNARFVTSVRQRSNAFLCAATVINNWNVLTAASCVISHHSSNLQIVMGSTDLRRRDTVISVFRITIHPDYSQSNPLNNNLAVLRLSRSIRHNSYGNPQVDSINLDYSSPAAPSTCLFIAWGVDHNLQQANLPVWQANLCGNSTNGMFCAGNLNNGPAVCSRNIGGSFVCNNRLSGIAIEDSGCSQVGTAGHFHSVNHYRDWILEVSNANLNTKISLVLGVFAVILKVIV